MSQFIKKLQEIKKETFRLNDFYIQELIELFDFRNDEDKNFILGNNEKSNFYEGDIYNLLKSLLNEDKLKDFESEIIENYKSKYLEKNSSIIQAYCLAYLELFIEYYKLKDYKNLFRNLYDNSDNEFVEKFINIFRAIEDEEYFVKSFQFFLSVETKHGSKYLSKSNLDFLLNLKDENFTFFIKNISVEGFVYLKDFDLEYTNTFLEKIKSLRNSDINNRLKNQLLSVIETLTARKKYNYDQNRLYVQFIKSNFCNVLTKYLGKVFTDLSLDIFDKIKSLFFGYWEIVILISNILNISNVKNIIEKSGKKFYDVYLYEQIEGGTRKDKKKLLEEFKKYKEFNKRLEKRKEILEKNKLKQEKVEDKEKGDFLAGIKIGLEYEQKNKKGINEYLLYHFDVNTHNLQKNKDIEKVVKTQVKRFFKLEDSNPERYEVHYTKRDENGASYTSHGFVVNHTFLRCLKLYKQFGFKITKDIIKKSIRYVPFAYQDSLEDIFSIIGNSELEKDDIDYLLSVYDGTRTKDDLVYHNISSFTWFYEKYKDNFIKYGKTETQNTFIKIINDEKYESYIKEQVSQKISEIGEQKQLLELFNKYKSDESYFSNISKITPAIIFGKALVKRFLSFTERDIVIDWFIYQLHNAKIPIDTIDYGEGLRRISTLESELSWDLKEENSFITVFKYINDLSFEEDIKKLLNYSFEIMEESKKDYKIFGNYIQQAVFNFYEGVEKKNLKKIFELEKEVNDNVKNDEVRILFKVNFLDKLIYIYSENVNKGEIHKIYKSVYNIEKDDSKENEKLKEELFFLKSQKDKLESLLRGEKKEKEKLKNEINRYKNEEKDDSVILFVEGKTDKRYLELAYKTLFHKEIPYKIEMLYGKLQVRNYINDIELLNYTYPEYKLFIALFDFDSAYNEFNGLNELKFYSNKVNKYIKKDSKNIRYAFLLPANHIHNDVKKNLYVDGDETKDHFLHNSEFEIEHLFYGFTQEIDGYFEDKDVVGGGMVKKLRDNKISFFNLILKEYNRGAIEKLFDNFKPIFEIVNEIIEDSKKP